MKLLALSPDERAQFVASRERGTEAASARSKRLLDYERANAQAPEMRARRTGLTEAGHETSAGPPSSPAPTSGATSTPSGLGDILSTLDDRAADLPVPVVGYRRHQARPAQSRPESALRARARRAGAMSTRRSATTCAASSSSAARLA